jgi:hypothetical protein
MAYTKALDATPIKGTNWTLSFGWRQSTGGVPDGTKQYDSVNFTCASAVLWNVNFVRNIDNYNMYGHMGATLVPEAERYELYQKLVDRFEANTFMVQMVGVVNGGTAARLRHYLSSENKHGYHTADFANFLITKKIGVVMESPIFVNMYHKWDGPSICQSWHWFSPSTFMEGAFVEHTGGIHGMENVPKFLQDSPINKKDIDTFDGMLNPSIVKAERFAKAAETWNNSIKKKPAKEIPTPGELWRKKVV